MASALSAVAFPGRRVLTCREVATALGLSSRHIADLCDEGTILGAFDIGGHRLKHWRIPVSAYDLWLKKRANESAAPPSARRSFF